MNKLKNLKIGKRLLISFILILITSSIGSIAGLTLLLISDNKYSTALVRYGFSQGDIGLLLQSNSECKLLISQMINSTDKASINELQEKIQQEEDTINTLLPSIEKTLDTEEEKNFYQSMASNFSQYIEVENQISQKILSNQKEEALDLYQNKGQPLLEASINSGNALMNSYKTTGNQLSSLLTNQSRIMIAVIGLIIVISIIISLFLATLISKTISFPINKILLAAKEISKGNLSIEIDVNEKDELGELADTFRDTIKTLNLYINDITHTLLEIGKGNLTIESHVEYQGAFITIQDTINHILDNLNTTLGNIGSASDMVASGSDEIASAGQSLSEGAMDQAGSIEELNATLNEILDQVSNNVNHSKEASQKAILVADEAEKSNTKMQEMIKAMSAINEASNQIEMIMKTIEDIASQTNLLSLNAAIEAARAGDAGKGFAVVANEIRDLAAQSAEAAKNTNTLIGSSIHAVNNGTKIVDETALALQTVVTGVHQMNDNIETITNASEQQATSLSEISKAVEQISGVVQNNSATAQESAASSEELSSQSQILKALIKKFTLKYIAKS